MLRLELFEEVTLRLELFEEVMMSLTRLSLFVASCLFQTFYHVHREFIVELFPSFFMLQ